MHRVNLVHLLFLMYSPGTFVLGCVGGEELKLLCYLDYYWTDILSSNFLEVLAKLSSLQCP